MYRYIFNSGAVFLPNLTKILHSAGIKTSLYVLSSEKDITKVTLQVKYVLLFLGSEAKYFRRGPISKRWCTLLILPSSHLHKCISN